MASNGKLGRRLRKLRTAASLTQHDLAAPDYTHAYVSQIESGRRDPSPAAMEHFARKLGIGVDELRTGRPPDLEDRLELDLQDARRAAAAGQTEQALLVYESVQKQAQRYALPRHISKALVGRALCAELNGELDEAISLYEEAEGTLDDGSPTARIDALAGRTRCLQIRGETRTSIYLLEQALETLQRQKLTDPDALIRLHTSLVAAYFERGAYDRAYASAEEALALAPQTKDPERLASMHVNVARIFLDQGRTDEAHDSLRRAEDLYRQVEMKSQIGSCYHSRGYILARQGHLEEAESELEKALDIYRSNAMPLREARSTIELARIKRLRDDLSGAEEMLERALELLGDKNAIEIAEARRELAMCRKERQPGEAEELLRGAAELFQRSEEQTEFAATRRLLGDLLMERGDIEGAARAFREGIVAVEERL